MRHPARATAGALIAATIATTLAWVATTDIANAGLYHVYSCRTPDEQPAPTDGWTKSTSPASSASVVAEDGCASGGALVAGLQDGVKHEVNSRATWAFTSLPEEKVAAATLWRAGEVDGGNVANGYYEFWLAGPTNLDRPADVFDECVNGFSCSPSGIGSTTQIRSSQNAVVVPSEHLDADLFANASCGGEEKATCPEGKSDPNGYASVVYLYAADIVLEDESPPVVLPGTVSGELATASVVKGNASLLFGAEDAGSGIYQANVIVDGIAIGSTTIDTNGRRCVDLGESTDGLPGFLYMRPCPSASTAAVDLDTTTLSDGSHLIQVNVTDAAGNSTAVLKRNLEVLNKPPLPGGVGASTSPGPSSVLASVIPPGIGPAALGAANGSPASAQAVLVANWAAHVGQAITGRWGRSLAISGRLTTAAGTPIAGASIEASAVLSAQGAHAKRLGTPRTDGDGRFTLRLPGGSGSERVVLDYRVHAGDPLPSAEQVLTLTVPASLTLRVAPRTSRLGGTIHFTGGLRGRPIPAGGKQVVLQARSRGQRWRTFKVLSTDRGGRYHASYRFRLPGPVVYGFRAYCPHEADYPFASGFSKVVVVRER